MTAPICDACADAGAVMELPCPIHGGGVATTTHGPESNGTERPGARQRVVLPGGGAIFDDDGALTALWGATEAPLWAAGESLFVVGPIGVGKTTLGQRLLLARLGLSDAKLLGLPVAIDPRRFLYIAADRPRQALRSMRRMVTEDQRELLDERLAIWKGPLPFDLVKEPWRLSVFVQEHGCAGAFIDSLKDIAVGISSDDVGAQVNIALQECSAVGLELIVNHHQRKATAENRRPNTLDDVYGSTWLTAGAGSVVILWGRAGDPVLELHHLKQPAEEVGPLTVRVDHTAGAVEQLDGMDLFAALRNAPRGLAATGAAMLMFQTTEPGRNQVEKARRRLDALVRRGVAHGKPGGKDDAGRQQETLYFPIDVRHGRDGHDGTRDGG
jgi:replicative DNA helicase